ncbi:hypothetical protein B0H11DRAFT_540959 [Mycena galericulata]|nr:hypothetical protein B0H11DRAFT_540959 [Mycena galericulata]
MISDTLCCRRLRSISAAQTSDLPLPSCPLTSPHAVTRCRPVTGTCPALNISFWRLCPAQDAASMYRTACRRPFTTNRSSDKHEVSYGDKCSLTFMAGRANATGVAPPGLVPEAFDSVDKIPGRVGRGAWLPHSFSLAMARLCRCSGIIIDSQY